MSTKSKGLSSVVGAVLLITISVGAAASAWGFIDTVTQGTQETVEDRIDQDQEEARSELSSDIAYNSSEGYTLITVRNTGSSTLLIIDDGEKRMNMFVEGRPEEWTYPQSAEEKNALQPQETATFNTTVKYPERDQDYSIQVNGPSGTSTTYICYNSGTASC